jgi:hypothetical protein
MCTTGKISGCDFLDQSQLALGTWHYVEVVLHRYIGARNGKPLALVTHPTYLEELLMALDAPGANLSLLDGISIQIDERCYGLHVIDCEGQLRKL